MDIKIPKKFILGGIDYTVEEVDSLNKSQDFGYWTSNGQIEIANTVSSKQVSESRKRQTLWHEVTHAILHQMGEYELCDDERFVNTFSSFLSGAIDTMK